MSSDELVVRSSSVVLQEFQTALWNVPEAFIPDEGLQDLYELLATQLRQDNPDADTLEIIMIERVAALYVFLRYRELTGDTGSLTAYHKNIELWAKLVDQLRRKRVDNSTDEVAKSKMLAGVSEAFQKTLTGLEPEVAAHIRQKFAKNLSEV